MGVPRRPALPRSHFASPGAGARCARGARRPASGPGAAGKGGAGASGGGVVPSAAMAGGGCPGGGGERESGNGGRGLRGGRAAGPAWAEGRRAGWCRAGTNDRDGNGRWRQVERRSPGGEGGEARCCAPVGRGVCVPSAALGGCRKRRGARASSPRLLRASVPVSRGTQRESSRAAAAATEPCSGPRSDE